MFVVIKNISFHERGRVRRTVTPTNKLDYWLGPMRIPARTTAVRLNFYRQYRSRFDNAVDLGLIDLDFKAEPGETTEEVAKIMAELFPEAEVIVDGKPEEVEATDVADEQAQEDQLVHESEPELEPYPDVGVSEPEPVPEPVPEPEIDEPLEPEPEPEVEGSLEPEPEPEPEPEVHSQSLEDAAEELAELSGIRENDTQPERPLARKKGRRKGGQ